MHPVTAAGKGYIQSNFLAIAAYLFSNLLALLFTALPLVLVAYFFNVALLVAVTAMVPSCSDFFGGLVDLDSMLCKDLQGQIQCLITTKLELSRLNNGK